MLFLFFVVVAQSDLKSLALTCVACVAASMLSTLNRIRKFIEL